MWVNRQCYVATPSASGTEGPWFKFRHKLVIERNMLVYIVNEIYISVDKLPSPTELPRPILV
jgi:hypothetical protein